MALPLGTQLKMFSYIAGRMAKREARYPLVLMLEPLLACNLECTGCGKVQHPPEVLKKRLSPGECWEASMECGAPMVSVAGGEPLLHHQMPEIVEGLIRRGRHVYLCTNALLLEKKLPQYRPSPLLTISVHLDGPEHVHDRVVCREGVYRNALAAIRSASEQGFSVMINTTIFHGVSPQAYRKWFDECAGLGIRGMMISPGYPYEKASGGNGFLTADQSKAWFREALFQQYRRKWKFNHSPFYLDFLQGRRDYNCTPWGIPTRNVFGWQRPCYLLDEGCYASSYRELLETTPWDEYGPESGNEHCLDCRVHSGYEPSAVIDMFSGPWKFLEMLYEMGTGGRHFPRPEGSGAQATGKRMPSSRR